MPEYLQLLTPDMAVRVFYEGLPSFDPIPEKVKTLDSIGRVTCEPVIAPQPLPEFSRSTVDGYAVKSKDTFGASDSFPAYLSLIGEIPMGGVPSFSIGDGQAASIHTGGMIPEGADSVEMIEFTQRIHDKEIEVLRPVSFQENIILLGEDVKTGQVVLNAGQKIRPADMGGLLALGLHEVNVSKKIRVGILSSGDELVPPDKKTSPGQVRDINSFALGAMIEQAGGFPVMYGIVPDDIEKIKEVTRKAYLENDLTVITAGSSASIRDLTAEAIGELGKPGVIVHGINIKPGKPTILAVCDGKPVIGLPGNPVSALVIAKLFVIPLVERMLGQAGNKPKPMTMAKLEVNIPSQTGREDWVPVKLSGTPDSFTATPIFFKSNLIFSLSGSDGFVRVPPAANGLEARSMVEIFLL